MVEADREGAATASETISSIRMVAACGAEGKMAETYACWVRKAAQRGQKMSKWIAVQSSLGKSRSPLILQRTKSLTLAAKFFSLYTRK
jgi:nickel-dependent lactate racemase